VERIYEQQIKCEYVRAAVGYVDRASIVIPDVSDEQTKHLALALFQKLQAITVCGDDQRRELGSA